MNGSPEQRVASKAWENAQAALARAQQLFEVAGRMRELAALQEWSDAQEEEWHALLGEEMRLTMVMR